MKREQFGYDALATVVLLAGVTGLWAAGASQPATAYFRDSTSTISGTVLDSIRSDSLGPYREGVGCVRSYVASNGSYFLRTVSIGCTASTPRSLVLDFSNPVTPPTSCTVADPNDSSGATLDVCCSNAIPDARFGASTLFSSNALSKGTAVSVVFSLQTDFRNTDFELDFEQPAQVTGDSNSRVLTADAGAIAELYELIPRGKVSLGRFYMPF